MPSPTNLLYYPISSVFLSFAPPVNKVCKVPPPPPTIRITKLIDIFLMFVIIKFNYDRNGFY